MPDLPRGLHPGMRIALTLATGDPLEGEIEQAGGGWLRLRAEQGTLLVQLAHVAVVALPRGAAAPEIDEERPRPQPKDSPRAVGAKAPGRPWPEDELRRLADAFLDGMDDARCAERFDRTRGAIKELRAGFECARGNLVEDQISPVAQTWVTRWRRVLVR